MSQPLTNDFGVAVRKELVKKALRAAGWLHDSSGWTTTWNLKAIQTYGYHGDLTLREAWSLHKDTVTK